jgi:uncharacterized membrane protein YccC
MAVSSEYVREIRKFTTSQYWSAGVRITAGVMVPTLIMAHQGWLQVGLPFLWGSLFVSLTDTPGPIHHRRNGMLAAIALNTLSVLLATLCRDYPVLLLAQIIVLTFSFSLLGIYGSRAGAVGTLAIVIMLLNLFPRHGQQGTLLDTALIASGGIWYMGFSLLLYRLRPYRLAEQAIGEHLIAVAEYIRARGSFYKPGSVLKDSFDRVMEAQVAVQKSDEQTRELLFKTRQFVTDASPKSRSMMMIFLDAVDLFEHSLLSYQDYESLHKNLQGSNLLAKFYSVILPLTAELEYIGLLIQSGRPVRKNIDMTATLSNLESSIDQYSQNVHTPAVHDSLQALKGTLSNIRNIANRLQRIILYSRLEVDLNHADAMPEATKLAAGQPLEWQAIVENLTLESNNFRYSLRLTLAMLAGFGVSVFFSLSHTYWVLLTIITILRPVYTVTRKRNIQRLGGTFVGAFLAIIMLSFILNTTILLTVMILSMLIAYSLLRVNYFGFVLFLTLFIIITFHFLNPVEVRTLIGERLLDTVIGSIIAAFAARFILPVWEHEQIETSLADMLAANKAYFAEACKTLLHQKTVEAPDYKAARKKAIVTLTNLSDTFQKMLAEPQENKRSIPIHQVVIANHMLTGHIAALPSATIFQEQPEDGHIKAMVRAIEEELQSAENYLRRNQTPDIPLSVNSPVLTTQTLHPLSIIYSLSHDIRLIVQKM